MKSSNVVSAFLIGCAVGAGAALLFAPRSGKETREWISDTGRKSFNEASRAVEDAVARAADAIEKGKDMASGAAATAKTAYTKAARALG